MASKGGEASVTEQGNVTKTTRKGEVKPATHQENLSHKAVGEVIDKVGDRHHIDVMFRLTQACVISNQ